MEVDSEPVTAIPLEEKLDGGDGGGGLDSDDETLRFDKDDDLYDVAADEEDAKWVAQQHRPVAECEAVAADGGDEEESEKKGEKTPANGKSNAGVDKSDDADSEDDEDEIAGDEPPTISDRTNVGDSRGGGGGGGSSGGSSTPKKQEKKGGSGGNKAKQAGLRGGSTGVASDAQLSCPLCFTTVCLECQRHAKYSNQFRAVTGINVTVNYEEFLTLDQLSGGGGGGGRRKGGRKNRTAAGAAAPASTVPATARHSGNSTGQQGPGEEEVFHPVSCGECEHPVGVYDAEEVFHFFGVIASG